jgi:hypothetical protein
MGQDGVRDPLGTARVTASLAAELEQLGYAVSLNEDLSRFAAVERTVKNDRPSPFFDPDVNALPGDRVFWMQLTAKDGAVCGLQAFRLDTVDSSLADWGPSLHHRPLHAARKFWCRCTPRRRAAAWRAHS